ncbi:MAG: transporter substrate-binding domain-containing protein [Rhizobium sp.]|nr:MAG: transporter substrate-binding domain-containing protein [Rhizobium sp.]
MALQAIPILTIYILAYTKVSIVLNKPENARVSHIKGEWIMTKSGSAAKLIALLAGGMLAASAPASRAADAKFQTATPGVLVIATEVGNPGWMNGTDPGNVKGGVEWAMAEQLAKDWGIPKVVFRNISFTPLISGTATGYDIGLMTIFKTPAREKVNTYSDCYYVEDSGALVKKGTKLATEADAKKLQWGHVTGGYAGLILQKLSPDKQPKAFQDGPTEYNALLSGTVDAILDDFSSVAGRTRAAGFENTEVAGILALKGVPAPCAAAQLPKSAPGGNVSALNAELAKFKSEGLMKSWMEQYLAPNGVDPSKYKRIEIQ